MQLELNTAELAMTRAALAYFRDMAHETLVAMRAPNARNKWGDTPTKREIERAMKTIEDFEALLERFA